LTKINAGILVSIVKKYLANCVFKFKQLLILRSIKLQLPDGKLSPCSGLTKTYGKQGVCLEKNENHRGTTRLFTSAFSRLPEKTWRIQRDRSELIRELTHIIEV